MKARLEVRTDYCTVALYAMYDTVHRALINTSTYIRTVLVLHRCTVLQIMRQPKHDVRDTDRTVAKTDQWAKFVQLYVVSP